MQLSEMTLPDLAELALRRDRARDADGLGECAAEVRRRAWWADRADWLLGAGVAPGQVWESLPPLRAARVRVAALAPTGRGGVRVVVRDWYRPDGKERGYAIGEFLERYRRAEG